MCGYYFVSDRKPYSRASDSAVRLVEFRRLTKEIARCEGMLNNPNFVNKAPAAKVEAEKEKLEKYKEMKEKVNLQLTQMVK